MTDDPNDKSRPPRGVTLRRLLVLARPEAPRLAIATLALFVSSGMALAYPQAVRFMIDTLTGEEAPFSLDTGAVLLVVLFAIQSVFAMLRAWLFTVSGERIVADLRTRLFESILGQDVEFFDLSRTGELTNRLTADTGVLQNTVTVNVSMALRHTLGALGGTALLLWMSPKLTAIAMVIVPLGAVGGAIFGRYVRRISQKVQDALAASTVIAEEAIAGIRTVRSFAREKQEVERYDEAVEESFRLAAQRALAFGGFGGFFGFMGYGTVALVVWYGGRLVADDQMTLGALTAFLLYTGLVAVSLGSLANLYGDFMRAVGASQRVFDLIDSAGTIERQSHSTAKKLSGSLRFENVDFAYPSRPDVTVLSGFELEASPGDVIALVGPSGAGKSTVASLIPRFYDPTGGRILVDGTDLREIAPGDLRRQVGAVMQEPVLFAGSITENIRYGNAAASADEVRAAAVAANAMTFIEEFPEGLETTVGERGVRLSGGQKQRIAIARAVLKDPRILILDEATSALDAESEHLVQEALDRLMKGRTTLVIAHRLSTVRSADRVVVLDQGRVVEMGRHDELMAAGGLYRRLVERQFTEAA